MDDRRSLSRKTLGIIEAEDLTLIDGLHLFAARGVLKSASIGSFVVLVERKDLVASEYRETLDLSEVEGKDLALFLPQMNLDLDGTISRVRHAGKGFFEVVVAFSSEVPQYWRECLVELLPSPEELEYAH